MGDSEDDTMPLGGETVGTAYVRLHILGDGLDAEVRREIRKTTKQFNDAGHEQGEVFGDAFSQEFVRRFRSHLDRMGNDPNTTRSVRRFSDTIGRLFGRGSRNNFLNFFGSVARNAARLGEVLSDAASGGLTDFINKVKTLIGGGGGGLRGMGAALRGGAAGGVGLIAAFAVLFDIVGMVSSALSGLAGIATALASTAFYGLTGAAVALGGAGLAAGSGLGVLVLAITHLDDATKNKLQPIADEWAKFGQIAADSFGPALVRNVDGIVQAMKPLEPIIEGIADALGRVLDGLVDSLNGPAWRRFENTFGKALPRMVENLGDTFTNLGEAFAGIFTAATPLTRRFARYLEDISDRFADWVNSDAGQQKLRTFFADAAESAEKIGDFLGSVAEAFLTLADAGKETGDNLLGKITDAIDRFTTWAQSDEGQKALADWFAFAEKLGDKLGEIVLSAIELFDELDSPRARKNLLFTLGLINNMIQSFTWLARKINSINDSIANVFGAGGWIGFLIGDPDQVQRAWQNIKSVFGRIDWGKVFGNPLSWGFWNKLLFGTADPIGQIKSRFSGLASRISTWIGDVDWSKIIQTPWPHVNSLVAGLANRIGDAMGNVDWGDVFSDPWSWVRDKVSGLGGRIADAIGSIDLTVNIDWPDPPGWFSKLLSASPGGTAIVLGSSASGGVFDGAQARIIGEAGPEAVVPLRRPLGQVDPAVRELSAFAQGLTGRPGRPNQTNIFNVTTPTKDPHAVAVEVVNRLAAVGGF